MKNTKIGIVGGLGHIGLIQGACLAELGYLTVAYDYNVKKVEEILQGKLPFFEPELEEAVNKTVKNGRLRFTASVKDLEESDLIFICVGTPSLPSGEADTSQVYTAVEEIARNRENHCLAVVKSTVPVGTNRKLTEFLKDNGLSERVTMVSNPEFLREGSGVNDFWKPSRIIVGAQSKEHAERVAGLYSPPGVPVIITSWENAELIKHAANAFLASKISFINEIAALCEKVGGDIRVVSRGIGLDPRINPYFLEAGVGFSGPCLEKDLKSLISQFQKVGEKAKLLESALEINERQRNAVVHKLQGQLGTLKGRRIGILGMAFKAETDDVRDSHSLPIIRKLLALGAALTVHDPWIQSFQQAGLDEGEFPEVRWATSPYKAAEGQDALLILTAWPEYRKLDLQRLREALVYPLIVDGRNMFDAQEMQALNIKYLGVGI